MSNLSALGWGDFFQEQLDELAEPGIVPARVCIQYPDRLRVITAEREHNVTPSGRLRFEATGQLAAVGDWVGLRDDNQVVHVVFKRRSAFVRQAAQDAIKEQIIATNIDTAFVVTACNSEFNPRRIERYVTAIWDSGANPVVVLNKSDLASESDRGLAGFIADASDAALGGSVVSISAINGDGLEALEPYLGHGKTGVLVGSSGVGKSTLVNRLVGGERQSVKAIRAGDDKGRHTTTHRELIELPRFGGLLIDTPGMREFRLRVSSTGAADSFADIDELASQCRFNDCSHESEPCCAVRDVISAPRLASYRKLGREIAYENNRRDGAAHREAQKRWRQVTLDMRQRARSPLGGKLKK